MKGPDKMKVSNRMRLALAGAAVAMLSVSAVAQGYYDDDIYFDSSKAKAKKTTQTVVKKTPVSSSSTTVVTDNGTTVVSVPASALSKVTTSTSYSGSTRDVDEYNRRGS